MNWLERIIGRERQEEATRQKALQETLYRERRASQERDSKALLAKKTRLGKLVKRHTGKDLEGYLRLEDLFKIKDIAGDWDYTTWISGYAELDGVRFGIATTHVLGNWTSDAREYSQVVVFRKGIVPRYVWDLRVVHDNPSYRAPNSSVISLRTSSGDILKTPIGFGQALMELGYGTGTSSSPISSSRDGYIGGHGPTREPRPRGPR